MCEEVQRKHTHKTLNTNKQNQITEHTLGTKTVTSLKIRFGDRVSFGKKNMITDWLCFKIQTSLIHTISFE